MRKELIWCFCISFLLPTVASAQRGSKAPAGPANVVVSTVVKTKRAGHESFIGTLQAVKKSVVGTAVDGRVMQVLVEAGDPVNADSNIEPTTAFVGQPLVQLRTGTLEIEIESARIQLQLAKQSLAELEAMLPSDLELAQAKSVEAAARLNYSEAQMRRLKQMSEAALSKLELDEANSQFEVNKQLAVAATEMVKRFKATRGIRIEKAKSEVAAAQQEVKRLNDLLRKYTIRAPFEGYVTAKMTEVGRWATKGESLIEVVQLNPIEMIIDVPQIYIGQLQSAMNAQAASSTDALAEIVFEGIPQSLRGRIKRIIPQADLQLRSFPVRIEIENPKRGDSYLLNPGMLGRASLSIGTPVEMLMVKKDALVLSAGLPSILRIRKDGDKTTADKVTVQTGRNIGDWIQVTGDIRENDQVVVQGNERLRPGQALKISSVDSERLPPAPVVDREKT